MKPNAETVAKVISELNPRIARPSKPTNRVTAASDSLEDVLNDESITVPELLVEGLLPRRGLVLLGGRPKDGKSWMACQVALAVVTGQALCGWLRVTEPGRAHLWALEDRKALTKDKCVKLLNGSRPDGLSDMRLFEELAQPVLRGGDQIIDNSLTEHPAELVILDSLFKLTGASQPSYDIGQRDYDVIDRLRKLAIAHHCCMVVIMHTKKGSQGGNPIENLLGTSGTPAAADVVAELKRFKSGSGKLTIVGRCVPAEDFELEWHAGNPDWGWSISDAGDDANLGETSIEILSYLQAQGPTKPSTIATGIHKSFGSVWQALLRLKDKGKVTAGADKRWDLRR